jgi:hypothetical protein
LAGADARTGVAYPSQCRALRVRARACLAGENLLAHVGTIGSMSSLGLPNDTPDWKTLTVELRCPRCGYDLRMLPQARCPECGLEFRWGELIAAARQRLKSPLFEYHWRDRPVRSFFGTLGRAMVPWVLWRKTRLALEPRVGPLLALVAIIPLVHAVVHFILWTVFVGYVVLFLYTTGWPGPQSPSSGEIAREWLLGLGRIGRGEFPRLTQGAMIGIAVWMFVQIFRQSFARSRVRPGPILRVVVLAWIPLIVWTLLRGLFEQLVNYSGGLPFQIPDMPLAVESVGEILALGLAQLSLCLGLSMYLKLRRGWLIGLVSGGTLFLAVFTVVLAGTAFHYDYFENPLVEFAHEYWPALTRGIERVLTDLLS